MKEKFWKDIAIGDEFIDGSKVVSIHESYEAECYDVYIKNKKLKNLFGNFNTFNFKNSENHCILSDEHLLLCDIRYLNNDCKKWVEDNFGNYSIPTLYDKHIYCKNLDEMLNSLNEKMTKEELMKVLECGESEKLEVIESDLSKISENEYWLPVKAIFHLIRECNQKIICNGKILHINYAGKKKVFCVETDTHKFETAGLIHHNSVTLRNIIFHCLTHGEQICIALIDLKYTEFTPFKGVKNVVAVANTVREAAEIMRLGREVMYKRNQELAKIGINDIKDFRPTKPTDEVIVAGRKLKDSDTLEIRLPNGEEKTVTVKELEQYL